MVVFNERIADVAERYLKKGAKVYVEGSLQTRKWTDQAGQEKYTTEVVIDRFRGDLTMLGGRGDEGGASGGGGYEARGGGGGGGYEGGRGGAASRRAARAAGGGGGGGGPSWDSNQGGGSDLDDEIPF